MTGTVGAAVRGSSLLAVIFGAVGLTAGIADADYMLIPTLILCLGLVGFSLYRVRLREKGGAYGDL
ncbi:MAG TPA: mercury resistance system transport protein MerF [Xanthobacteraceae bacterium]|nr:mercury resistance system transport protein MerF [Xanthobacteraceae bacterium]